ncbi:autophagy-related protein 16 [Schizothecium vesticola]|uniref:Autophagy-related protein 16 n=1 Tax=Schizothecium vesticola TaxID=314040 RepID=A0AA40EH66_9PEZI|nr:autophagy-related protein 16 [Schizothecium vesticola]
MLDWREEFLAGIIETEQQNPVNRELVDACSQLADRIAVLEAEKAALLAEQQASFSSTAGSNPPSNTRPDKGTEPTDVNEGPLVAKLRFDLAEALRARGQFQIRLQAADEELARLRSTTAAYARTVRELTKERQALALKLRDREEELKVKTKLVSDVQDENAVLNIELDMAVKKRKEKEVENKQLVERYMQRIGEEADAMNRANEPLFAKKRSK